MTPRRATSPFGGQQKGAGSKEKMKADSGRAFIQQVTQRLEE